MHTVVMHNEDFHVTIHYYVAYITPLPCYCYGKIGGNNINEEGSHPGPGEEVA